MPPLSKDQQKFYENAIEMAKRHIDEIDAKVEEELSRIKERLAALQNEKKNVRSIYDSACAMLGGKAYAVGSGNNWLHSQVVAIDVNRHAR